MEENIDVDKFAAIIKTKKSIWNYKCKEYADKQQRREDWISVCEEMVPDFNEKSSVEKSAIVHEYQHKWRVLRDGFTRSVKNYNRKLGTGNRGKLYLYYEQLHFLHEVYETKTIAGQSSGASSSRRKPDKVRKRLKASAESSSEDLIDEIVPDISVTDSSSNKVEEDTLEEDRQFLLSLLSDFRKIPEDQKLDAKGDIINVIRHYRNTGPFEASVSYYTNDITALATTVTDCYYDHEPVDECSRSSPSPIDLKFSS